MSEGSPIEHRCVEACPICRAADIFREAGAGENLGQGVGELQREVLMTARALIDHYLERLDQPPDPEGRVESIPID